MNKRFDWKPLATILPLMLGGCGPAPMAPRAAYIVVPAANEKQGWAVLDALDGELTPKARSLVQVRSLVSSNSPTMVVRFGGDCTSEPDFAKQVIQVAKMHGVPNAYCSVTLPVAG